MAKPDRLARALVDAAFELNRRRLWLEIPVDAPFLVQVPGEEHPMLVTITGQTRGEYGAYMFRGPGGIARALRWAEVREPRLDITAEWLLTFTMAQYGQIGPSVRGPLNAAGFRARKEAGAPVFLAQPPGQHARVANRSEMRLLLHVLRGILQVHDAGRLIPPSITARAGRILQIDVPEDPKAEATSRIVRFDQASEQVPASEPIELPWDLAALPRTEGRWVVALCAFPAEFADEPRVPQALAVCDEVGREPLGDDVVLVLDDGEARAELERLFRDHGLPREVVFANERLQQALTPALERLGVEVSLDPEHELLEVLAVSMKEGKRAFEELQGRGPEALEEWREADARFTARLFTALGDCELFCSRALSRYYGDQRVGQEAEGKFGEFSPIASFLEWLAADYRPKARSRNFLEEALRTDDWTETERVFLKGRSEAELSIYRVVKADPGVSVELEDLLTGRRYTVHDRPLSGSNLEGQFLPLRLFRAGGWTLCAQAGPALSVLNITRATQRLESLGLELTPQGMRKSAHLLGRLWAFMLETLSRPVILENTDGEPLTPHTATFRVADAHALAAELAKRDDVHVDEREGGWIWFRQGEEAHGFGQRLRLGLLRPIGDELLLEVNSAERFQRARGWLERIPGVRFERVAVRDPDSEPPPRDDTLPQPRSEPPDPRLVEHLRQVHFQSARRWLDLPVPALGNLTPRAACATEEGRRRVAVMVRAMPPMNYSGGQVPAPTELLLAELGIGPQD